LQQYAAVPFQPWPGITFPAAKHEIHNP